MNQTTIEPGENNVESDVDPSVEGLEESNENVLEGLEYSVRGLPKAIRILSRESSSANELYQKLRKKFGKKLTIIVSVVPVIKKFGDIAYMRMKIGGLFLKDGSFARVTIIGLTRNNLEF